MKHFIIFILILFCIPSAPLHAKEAQFLDPSPTIKVGVSEFPPFFTEEEDGTYRGILCDYLSEISKYTGWQIEYVKDSPSALLTKLSSGEIDLLGSMNKTVPATELYDFANLPSGYAYSVLVTNSDNEAFTSGDYDTFTKDMKVGIYTNSVERMEAFEQFRVSNALSVTPVYYDDSAKWEKCLATGEVDAVLTNSAKIQQDEKILATFKKENYYFATTKGNTDIVRALNIALEKIELINPQFANSVYVKNFDQREKNMLSLTKEDQNFVKDHPVLKVVTAPDWKPVSYYDKSNNAYSGITVDVLKEISESSGFQFEFIQVNSFKECLDLLASGEADLLAGIYDTGFLSTNCDVSLSIPYLPTQTLILHRKETSLEKLDNLGKLTLAMPYGFDFQHNYKNCTVVYYDTVKDCMDAVKDGAADFSAISSLAVEQYTREFGSGNLALVPVASSTMELSLAFANPTSPTLLSIIDKSIFLITESTKQSIVFKNTSWTNNKLTFLSFINSNPTQAISLLAAVSLLLLLFLFIIMQMRLRLSQNISLNAEAYSIIEELSNEYLFEYDFIVKEMKLPNKFAKLADCRNLITPTSNTQEGIAILFSSFEENKNQTNFTIEFKCTLATGKSELFRATCAVLYNTTGKPVRGIGKIMNIQADFEEKEQLQIKANTDSLTDLHNKRYCEEFILDLFENPHDLQNAAILLIDLDHFKEVNDTIGHLGGDAALIHFSSVLKNVFQGEEILGRWGGDEFFVFAPNIPSKKYLEEKASQLCSAIDTEFSYEGITRRLSISTGVAFTTENFDYQVLFQTADEALYWVKHDTRNGYHISDC